MRISTYIGTAQRSEKGVVRWFSKKSIATWQARARHRPSNGLSTLVLSKSASKDRIRTRLRCLYSLNPQTTALSSRKMASHKKKLWTILTLSKHFSQHPSSRTQRASRRLLSQIVKKLALQTLATSEPRINSWHFRTQLTRTLPARQSTSKIQS